MTLAVSPPATLWKGRILIETDQRSFSTTFHIANGTEADNIVIANRLALRLRNLIPADAEITYATLSKDGPPKDSLFLASALGAGLYVEDAGPPAVLAKYDYSKVAALVRFESDGGGNVTRKFGPIPDVIITSGHIIPTVTPVTGMPVAPAAPGAATWQLEFLNFMKDWMISTHHVKSNHAPGGDFNWFAWKNAYSLRVGDKKGGRLTFA